MAIGAARAGMLVLGLMLQANGLAAQEAAAPEAVGSGTYARVENATPPEYPRRAAQRGIEGWVRVGFCVKPDGTTAEATVVERSIEGHFEEAALEAIEGWTFTPATFQGEPVEQCGLHQRLLFQHESVNAGEVSRRFRGRYEKALDALREGRTADAAKTIESLGKDPQQRLTESFYLDTLRAGYYEAVGDDPQAWRYLQRALAIADVAAPIDMRRDLLRQAIVESARTHRLQMALAYRDSLRSLSGDEPLDEEIENLGQRIEDALASEDAIIREGKIATCMACSPEVDRWLERLNRSRFLIDEVAGAVYEIEVICDFRSVSIEFEPGLVWDVAQEWGECRVAVYGDNGTTFRFIEPGGSG